MAGVTKAALDAAVAQARQELQQEYADTVNRLEREATELRDKLRLVQIKAREEVESAKRSVIREVDASKSGGWRTRPKTIAGVLVLAALVVWLVFFLAGKARAAEIAPDKRFDVYAFCDEKTGRVFLDSELFPVYIGTNMPCVKKI